MAAERSLGELLAERRRHRFVGRTAELALARETLECDEPLLSVLYLHGPGGIGKSSLLDIIAESAAATGATIVRIDGRELTPTPADLLDALAASVDVAGTGRITAPNRLVLLIDTYERMAPLDGWLRRRLLPRLPATAFVVIAGRPPPDPAWRAETGLGGLLRVVALRNLSPAESREYLLVNQVDPEHHGRIVDVSHGHPLGLALLTDLCAHGTGPLEDPLPPDLVAMLLHRFVDVVPSERHRQALEVCALARVTTESLLRDALGLADAHELFAWLRDLSFVYPGGDGLYPHELARDALDADLRWRDIDGYQRIFHGVWTHIRQALRSTSGRAQQRAIFDLKYVFRNLPGVLSPVDWESWGGAYPEPAVTADRATVVALVAAAEGDESAAIAAHWFDRQPGGFHVLREHDGEVRGFLALLELTRADPGDIAADPGARAAWAFATRDARLRDGDVVTQTRFVIDRTAYQAPSPTLNATPILTMQRYLCTPDLAWDFLALAEPDQWDAYFAAADLPRATGADFTVGGRRYGLFAHDFRRIPVDSWLEFVTERALARDSTPVARPAEPELLVLSQAEFALAAKQALHDLRAPAALARNPLLRTRLLHEYAHGEPDAGALERLLRDAVVALGEEPRGDKSLRAVDRTYLRPAATQESAAALLGLPFSTYRRHLGHGTTWLTAWLWERDVHGFSGGGRTEQK
ncbi:ATP-binding protein [Nocardia sp. NPDC058499]|uniref:ATP-binding protein n=1 Tax=Nocardia sp. NPDC058499 TaxID=3346530 RepID=UPI003652A983